MNASGARGARLYGTRVGTTARTGAGTFVLADDGQGGTRVLVGAEDGKGGAGTAEGEGAEELEYLRG